MDYQTAKGPGKGVDKKNPEVEIEIELEGTQ